MHILKKPLITEKASLLNKRGVYGLKVDPNANKLEIRREIERFYGVTVCKIHTMRYVGKPRSRFVRGVAIKGSRPSYKKVLVKLKEGDTIEFYSNI